MPEITINLSAEDVNYLAALPVSHSPQSTIHRLDNAAIEACSELTKERSDGERLAYMGTDATRWVEEFTKLHGGDEGLMLGWFANAIEAGRTAGMGDQRKSDEDERLRSLIFQSLGEASVCWESMSGTGVFDSDRARNIGERLCAEFGLPVEDNESDTEQLANLLTNIAGTIADIRIKYNIPYTDGVDTEQFRERYLNDE